MRQSLGGALQRRALERVVELYQTAEGPLLRQSLGGALQRRALERVVEGLK